jgi:Kef-type K+ transport system membrane component KefB
VDVGHSLLYLILIIVAARIGGEIAESLRQPAVLGELLAGVGLGLTTLRGAVDDPAVAFIASIGVILLLFEVGLESELDEFRKVGRSAASVAVIGVILPLALGYALALALIGDSRQALFLGATLTATSVGITARVITDLGRIASAEARIILAAAVVDDILGLLVLSIVLGITSTGKLDAMAAGRGAGIAVAFLVIAVWVGIRYAPSLVSLAQRLRTRGVLVTVSFTFCLALALAAERLGLAEIVGAFAAGLVLATTEDRIKIQQQIKPLADVFIPVFFVVVGLQVNLASLNPLEPGRLPVLLTGAALLVLAVSTKLAAGLGVFDRHVSKIAVGVGMIPRGEVGLIFASVGLAAGILTQALYAVIVFVVFFSTLIAPPWLKTIFARSDTRGPRSMRM